MKNNISCNLLKNEFSRIIPNLYSHNFIFAPRLQQNPILLLFSHICYTTEFHLITDLSCFFGKHFNEVSLALAQILIIMSPSRLEQVSFACAFITFKWTATNLEIVASPTHKTEQIPNISATEITTYHSEIFIIGAPIYFFECE